MNYNTFEKKGSYGFLTVPCHYIYLIVISTDNAVHAPLLVTAHGARKDSRT